MHVMVRKQNAFCIFDLQVVCHLDTCLFLKMVSALFLVAILSNDFHSFAKRAGTEHTTASSFPLT